MSRNPRIPQSTEEFLSLRSCPPLVHNIDMTNDDIIVINERRVEFYSSVLRTINHFTCFSSFRTIPGKNMRKKTKKTYILCYICSSYKPSYSRPLSIMFYQQANSKTRGSHMMLCLSHDTSLSWTFQEPDFETT